VTDLFSGICTVHDKKKGAVAHPANYELNPLPLLPTSASAAYAAEWTWG